MFIYRCDLTARPNLVLSEYMLSRIRQVAAFSILINIKLCTRFQLCEVGMKSDVPS